MTITGVLGFPRMGPHRELKTAMEAYWKDGDEAALLSVASGLRKANWRLQQAHGIGHIPSNDFSLYDHVLDTICMTGAVPKRFGEMAGEIDLSTYYAMARGAQDGKRDVQAMEMTKWFDTNYHYIVPEFAPHMPFRLASLKALREFEEAAALGIHTRPVLLGPISFLRLGKSTVEGFDPLSLLDDLLPVYEEVLSRLSAAGADWVQIDEPCLALDLDEKALAAYGPAYARLAKAAPAVKLLCATYFGALPGGSLDALFALPVAGVHLDFVRGAEQADEVLAKLPGDKLLSAGLIDGRNIWRSDLNAALLFAEHAQTLLGAERLILAPSCSLLHAPYSLEAEKKLDPELKSWMAFATEKLDELHVLLAGLVKGRAAIEADLDANAAIFQARARSPRLRNEKVEARLKDVTARSMTRRSPFEARIKAQAARYALPPLPTTTIGSFPQTSEVRKARASLRKGQLSQTAYDEFMRAEIEKAVRLQEDLGIDVLVHGEFERTDMVEYFGEQLDGFAFTSNGWVQSYGSRCVKPPVIYGAVSRPEPMTVLWSRYAQSLTKRPMKGMLTGPVTILQWSFVRNDQPRERTCREIALAIRDEVCDLEAAGLGMIQIDEPALREGLPLRRKDWPAYLKWAGECFRLSVSAVRDETQIHTHMCYSEFNDIIEAIAALDADVISIETSRSRMELLDAFVNFAYPNDIGPGVYDIHSPRVPDRKEMSALLKRALQRLPAERLWVNPDCGLKTRGWPETEQALREMVEAAKDMRAAIR